MPILHKSHHPIRTCPRQQQAAATSIPHSRKHCVTTWHPCVICILHRTKETVNPERQSIDHLKPGNTKETTLSDSFYDKAVSAKVIPLYILFSEYNKTYHNRKYMPSVGMDLNLTNICTVVANRVLENGAPQILIVNAMNMPTWAETHTQQVLDVFNIW